MPSVLNRKTESLGGVKPKLFRTHIPNGSMNVMKQIISRIWLICHIEYIKLLLTRRKWFEELSKTQKIVVGSIICSLLQSIHIDFKRIILSISMGKKSLLWIWFIGIYLFLSNVNSTVNTVFESDVLHFWYSICFEVINRVLLTDINVFLFSIVPIHIERKS